MVNIIMGLDLREPMMAKSDMNSRLTLQVDNGDEACFESRLVHLEM